MKTRDLTKGNILKELLLFSLPLLLGNLFQQLYNTVDSIVVGNYVGKAALAAVGSSSSIILTLVSFFMGLSTGGSIAISQYYGAKDDKNLNKAIQSFFCLTVVFGIIITFLGIVISEPVLRAIKIPDDVMPEAVTYLKIYFFGVIGVMIYNMGSAILRAIGDSRRPLYFLCVSALLNVVLDLLFVIKFNMGVAGVAWATLISQFVSAVLVMIVLLTTKENYRLVLKGMRYHDGMTRKIFSIGFPVSIQQSITSISNIIVQSYINAFGSTIMAGYTSCMKIDVFIILPIQSLALALTTFVGQNVGAGQIARAKEGTKKGLVMTLSFIIPLSVIVAFISSPLLGLFTNEAEVVEAGKLFLRTFLPFYFTMSITHCLAGSLRGHGITKVPMYIMLSSFVVVRQLLLIIGTQFFSNVQFIAASFPATWVLAAVLMVVYYAKVSKTFNTEEALSDNNGEPVTLESIE